MVYPIHEREMTPEQAEQEGRQMAAVVSGAGNIPLDAVRYPALVANWAMEKLGIRSEDVARLSSDAINSFMDRPPFLSDEINDTREQLAEDHPGYTLAGEMLGATGLARGLLNRGMNLGKDQAAPVVYRNRLTNSRAYSPGAYYGAAAGGALANEVITENAIQRLAGYRDRE